MAIRINDSPAIATASGTDFALRCAFAEHVRHRSRVAPGQHQFNCHVDSGAGNKNAHPTTGYSHVVRHPAPHDSMLVMHLAIAFRKSGRLFFPDGHHLYFPCANIEKGGNGAGGSCPCLRMGVFISRTGMQLDTPHGHVSVWYGLNEQTPADTTPRTSRNFLHRRRSHNFTSSPKKPSRYASARGALHTKQRHGP